MFQGISRDEQAECMLRVRMQAEAEPIGAYVQDILNLFTKVDPGMVESTKIKHVIRGLKPSLLKKVQVMNNNSFYALTKNIRKVETAGPRVDYLLGEPTRGSAVAPPTDSTASAGQRVTPTNSSLEDKLDQLTS